MERLQLLPTHSVVLFLTSMVMSFEALKNISSEPSVSVMRSSLLLPPPGVVAVCTALRAQSAGKL